MKIRTKLALLAALALVAMGGVATVLLVDLRH